MFIYVNIKKKHKRFPCIGSTYFNVYHIDFCLFVCLVNIVIRLDFISSGPFFPYVMNFKLLLNQQLVKAIECELMNTVSVCLQSVAC